MYDGKVGLLAKNNREVNFVQMHLEEKPVDYDEMEDLLFSPILIWKSGKHPHVRHITHPPHSLTMMEAQLSSSPTTPSHTPPPKTVRPLSDGGGPMTASDHRRTKSPLHLKRTDLTDFLPAEDGHSKKKVNF